MLEGESIYNWIIAEYGGGEEREQSKMRWKGEEESIAERDKRRRRKKSWQNMIVGDGREHRRILWKERREHCLILYDRRRRKYNGGMRWKEKQEIMGEYERRRRKRSWQNMREGK
jgi:hypothetical protein